MFPLPMVVLVGTKPLTQVRFDSWLTTEPLLSAVAAQETVKDGSC